jgi:hypothetical protein
MSVFKQGQNKKNAIRGCGYLLTIYYSAWKQRATTTPGHSYNLNMITEDQTLNQNSIITTLTN